MKSKPKPKIAKTRHGMRCPCGGWLKVVRTKQLRHGAAVCRRHECVTCGSRHTSIQKLNPPA